MTSCSDCNEDTDLQWTWSPMDLTVVCSCLECSNTLAILHVEEFLALGRRTFDTFDTDILAQREHERSG